MIYRVEFFKDGSVVSCKEVESSLKEGGLVCYVEAETKTDAIVKAKSERAAWSARSVGKALARNRCKDCRSRPRREGKTQCVECADRHARRKLELIEIRKRPDAAILMEERARGIAARREIVRQRAVEEANRLAQELADRRWDAKDSLVNKSERSLMRQVLRNYDKDPTQFRDWALRMLGESQEVQAAE